MAKSVVSLTFGLLFLGIVASISYQWRSHPDSIDPENSEFKVANSVDVAVVGNKFRWTFRYPGPDGKLGTADDVESDRILHLPPEVTAKFHITSEDYVYILGIPLNENDSQTVEDSLGGSVQKLREIAVPKMTHFIEHGFAHTGTYDLMVDPLCGFQSLHDPKMGQIIVSKQLDFSNLFPAASGDDEPL